MTQHSLTLWLQAIELIATTAGGEIPWDSHLLSSMWNNIIQDHTTWIIIVSSGTHACRAECALMLTIIIGASLTEPHINGTAMHAIYGIICIYVCIYVYVIVIL